MKIFEKAKQSFNKLNERFKELWYAGYYLRAILTIAVPGAFLGLLICLVITGVIAVGDFLRRHYAELIGAALILWAFVAWWDKHKAEQIRLERESQDVREREVYADQFEAARIKDATYITQAKVIFPVARELGALGIVPPTTLSNLYSPGRTIPVAKGTVNLNLFLLQKDCETVDTDLLKHTLQTKVDQRLEAGEFPGIPDHHVYRGRVYSGLIVDRVRDSMGGFVEVYTVLVDDAYCRYCERRNLNSSILLPSVDRRDTDY